MGGNNTERDWILLLVLVQLLAGSQEMAPYGNRQPIHDGFRITLAHGTGAGTDRTLQLR